MRRLTLLLSLAVLLCVGGCVTSSTYQNKVDEAERLSGTVKVLETEYLTLQKQQEALLGEKRELTQNLTASTQQIADLKQDLLRARADLDRLERVLSTRGEEAGRAMTEMRQTIDRLEEQDRRLTQQNSELQAAVAAERVAREARVAEMKSTYDQLVTKMEAEITRGEVTISDLQGKLTVNMVERILFDSGKADIKPAGLEVLKRVGDILNSVGDKAIQVEGHSDNVPISARLAQTYPSNWELSAARAINVVHFLQEQVGIPGEKLSACGFNAFRPIADNATSEGRAQNRRIQIVLVPLDGKVVKPLE